MALRPGNEGVVPRTGAAGQGNAHHGPPVVPVGGQTARDLYSFCGIQPSIAGAIWKCRAQHSDQSPHRLWPAILSGCAS